MKKIIARLRKIEGQVRGLQKLLESQENYTEIMTQFRATQSDLESCFTEILNEQLNQCLLEKNKTEFKKIVSLLVKK